MQFKRFILSALLFGFLMQCTSNGDRKVDRPLSIVKHPYWSVPATVYEVNIRQYTAEGTFNAFRAHLPRLKQLGVDILSLMPVQTMGRIRRKGRLGRYYAIRDYKGISPEFGAAEDLKRLIDDIHAQGMYVILDWVAKHTSADHPWVRRHPEFYTHDARGHMVSSVAEWTDVLSLDYRNSVMRDSMAQSMVWWLREFNIDGFRCDMAEMVPVDFWDSVRPLLETVKPVFMLAEGEASLLHQRAFDMTYSWTMYKAFNGIARGMVVPRRIDTLLQKENSLYPVNAMRMRFLTNHDENSWNGTVNERLGAAHKALAVLMFTLPGKPLLYSGQEAELDKKRRFFEKNTIEWTKHDLSAFYGTLMHLYHEHPALHKGVFRKIETGDAYIYAFERSYKNDLILVVINLSDRKRKVVTIETRMPEKTPSLFADAPFTQKASLELPAWGYRVWIKSP